MNSLKKRVFSASLWFSGAFVFVKILAFIRLAIMARLLSQEQFGLLAVVVMVVASLWALSDAGIEVAVVQKQAPTDAWLHTAWQMNWMRGVLLAVFCWLSASPTALFFHQPELSMLLLWAALIPLIHGFTSLGYPLLQKSLNFKQRIWVDLSKEIVFTVVAVVLAIWWHADVTALLAGLLAGTLAAVIVSYWVHEYRPRMLFDWVAARQIMGFGGHLLGAGVLIFLMTNLDDVVVGRLLGMEQLGQYAIAFSLAGLMTSQLVELLGAVLFPTLSSLQDNPEKIKHILSKVLRLVMGVLTPIMMLVMIVTDLPIHIALGEDWLMIAPTLIVLVMMGWVRGLSKVFGPAILALGHSAKLHKMKWIEFILFLVLIVPFVMYWGIFGAALTLLITYLFSLFLHIQIVGQLLGSLRHLLSFSMQAVWPSILALIPAMGVRLFLPDTILSLWLIFLTYIVCWLYAVYSLEKCFIMDTWGDKKP